MYGPQQEKKFHQSPGNKEIKAHTHPVHLFSQLQEYTQSEGNTQNVS